MSIHKYIRVVRLRIYRKYQYIESYRIGRLTSISIFWHRLSLRPIFQHFACKPHQNWQQ